MASYIDEITGRITLYQGDSLMFVVTDLPDDEDYQIFFGFYDINRKLIGQEMPIQSNGSSTAIIYVSASLTDLLKVDESEEFATYYYGLKICNPKTGYEDTLIIGNKEIGDLNEVTVYPKQVEGITSISYTPTQPTEPTTGEK